MFKNFHSYLLYHNHFYSQLCCNDLILEYIIALNLSPVLDLEILRSNSNLLKFAQKDLIYLILLEN